MKTTYKNIPLLQKGYPTLFWIASAGNSSSVLDCITLFMEKKPANQRWTVKQPVPEISQKY